LRQLIVSLKLTKPF